MIETTYGLNTIIDRGQVALAKFNNETELKSTGSNTYQATQKVVSKYWELLWLLTLEKY